MDMKYLIATLSAIIFLTMPDIAKRGDSQRVNQTQKPLFSFGIIADVQYCDYDPVGNRFYRSSLSKLSDAMISLKKDSAEFVINLGDLIDRDYDSYKPVMDILDASGIKIYHCTGNHDYSVETRFKKRLPLKMPSGEGYYTFIHNNFRFIVLNGNELSTYASGNKTSIKQAADYIAALKNEGSINAIDWNGGISNKQLQWLKAQLDEASAGNEKVFIVCHFPVYPVNMHNLLNYREVLPLLENYHNIIAWFNGHNHAGNYGNFNMIHFLTMKGMVETENTGSFALIEVYRNKIWIRGSGREKGQILAY
jgi:manganese-dependent ADP-ribose/CDP-alcohol diphosphatase